MSGFLAAFELFIVYSHRLVFKNALCRFQCFLMPIISMHRASSARAVCISILPK